jgi:ABC-2 type transport system ATP-binding protein
MNNAIEIINLHKKYGQLEAVKNLTLNIKVGEFYGMLGPNGAGKSTTINSITGYVKPTSGQINVLSQDIEKEFRFTRSKIGIAQQEISNDWFFPIEDLLFFQAGFYGINKMSATKNIKNLLAQMGLEQHKRKKMRALSGGMKRRFQIAKALVHDPEILILDEPTAGVDVELRHELWDFLRLLHQSGKTVLLTTHYIDEAELLCSKVGIINDGRLIKEGTVADLKSTINKSSIVIKIREGQAHPFNQILKDYDWTYNKEELIISSESPNSDLPKLINTISTSDVKIDDIQLSKTSLEDVFLKLTGKKIDD